MTAARNPFEYDAAPNLDPNLLIEWFIEDHNYSRFLQSARNVLINGERGSGKSMALIYNSIPYQQKRFEIKGEAFPPAHVGIYIPCNTALTHKQEYKLLPEVEQAMLSEHFLVYGICAAIAKDFSSVLDSFSIVDRTLLCEEFAYLTGTDPVGQDPFLQLRRAVHERLKSDQKSIAKGREVELSFETSSFYTLVMPILSALRSTAFLKKSHLSLLVDDAHDLNQHQRTALNSWLGYREHTVFSLKVAIAGIRSYDMRTSFGGTILEGHDYITIDLEQPFQNQESSFGKFARDVVAKRLQNAGVMLPPDDFFPESETFLKELRECETEARREAIEGGIAPDNKKAISDYKYKYARALYFQKRPSKANKPTYSGFDTLVHLSTGVIRNLLDPCYWMFEEVHGELESRSTDRVPSSVQSQIVHDRSDKLWQFVRNKLDTQVEGCCKSDAEKLSNLFTALAEHFRHRLLHHKAEPRVLAFTISAYEPQHKEILEPLLKLAQRAQLLYVRSGPAKDGGGREDYFTPNRMLWPEYGLDVHGQHGRASLKAQDLVEATRGRAIPVGVTELQGVLFDGK